MRIDRRCANDETTDDGDCRADGLRQMKSRLLQKFKRGKQANHLEDRVERHLALGFDDRQQQLRRNHLLMIHCHGDIQPRQQQRCQQCQVSQHPQARRREIIDRAVLRRFHQNAEIDRRQISQRQPIDKQTDLSVQKPLAEGVRTFGIL